MNTNSYLSLSSRNLAHTSSILTNANLNQTVEITLVNKSKKQLGLTIIEIGVPSCLSIDLSRVYQLKKSMQIQAYSYNQKSRVLNLYLRNLKPEETKKLNIHRKVRFYKSVSSDINLGSSHDLKCYERAIKAQEIGLQETEVWYLHA